MILQKSVIYRGKEVLVEYLRPNSCYKILVSCDDCKEERLAFIRTLTKGDLCKKCKSKHLVKQMNIGDKYNRLTILRNTSVGYCECICDCGNIKEYKSTSVRCGNTKSCGCLQREIVSDIGKRMSEKWIKESHPNWKGGTSTERELISATKEYKQFRQSVFERDNFTCVKCNKIGGTLNCHHIESFSSNEKTRTDTNNGVTLCLSCHKKYHKTYGYSGANRIDFNKFINKQK